MKKYLYLAFAAMLLGLTACSSEDPIVNPEPEPNPVVIPDDPDPTPDFDETERSFGASNYKDPAVTGGRQDFYYLTDDAIISVEIAGYLNLTDEQKMAVGMSPIAGVELSTDLSFPEGNITKFPTQRLEDGRKFVITATNLKENTTYYFRTYLTGTIFGETRSFTTENKEEISDKMRVPTADATYIAEHDAQVPLGEKNTGIAYSKDKSLLTIANVKDAVQKRIANGILLSKSSSLSDLVSGTTYYYRAYRIIYGEIHYGYYNTRDTYVVSGEVKSFTTKGYNEEELAKQMTITANLNETTQMWTANIQSSLASQSDMQGKTIRYGITHNMTTSYTSPEYDKLYVTWIYRYTGSDWKTNPEVYKFYAGGRTDILYGAVVFSKTVYATGNGGSYQASIDNPYYNGMWSYNEYGEKKYLVEWWGDCLDYFMYDFGNWRGSFDVYRELRERIKAGIATESEISEYNDLAYEYNSVVNSNIRYQSDVKCYLQVFVEIDGIRYVVKEQEGKLRVPTPEDNPIDFNYNSY